MCVEGGDEGFQSKLRCEKLLWVSELLRREKLMSEGYF